MAKKVRTTKTTQKQRGFLILGPPVVMLALAEIVIGPLILDLIVYRCCMASPDINTTDCSVLYENASSQKAIDLEIKIEPYASVILMAYDIMDNVLPGIFAMMLGPWSDRVGRKPLLMAGFGGFATKLIGLTSAAYWMMSPWYFLMSTIPSAILGGHYALKIAYLCYIYDITSEGGIGLQLILLEASINAGLVIGALGGNLIYENYGHAAVFGTATFFCISAVAWTYFFVTESVKVAPKQSIKDIYKISFIKKLVTESPTKQEILSVCIIFLIICAFTLNWFETKGQMAIEFLFVRARLSWGIQHLSSYTAGKAVMRMIGLCIVSLHGYLAVVPDTFLIGIGFMSALGGVLTRSLTWKSWHMYLAVCVEAFAGINEPLLRSLLSKFVPAQDISKVYTLTSLLELLTSLASKPLYTLIYTSYLPPIYPSPAYMLSITLYTALLLCVIYTEILIRKSQKSPTYIAAAQEDLTS